MEARDAATYKAAFCIDQFNDDGRFFETLQTFPALTDAKRVYVRIASNEYFTGGEAELKEFIRAVQTFVQKCKKA
jgi:hypothetical protein